MAAYEGTAAHAFSRIRTHVHHIHTESLALQFFSLRLESPLTQKVGCTEYCIDAYSMYIKVSLELSGGCCFVNFMDNVFSTVDMLAVILINRSVKHTCRRTTKTT